MIFHENTEEQTALLVIPGGRKIPKQMYAPSRC